MIFKICETCLLSEAINYSRECMHFYGQHVINAGACDHYIPNVEKQTEQRILNRNW